MCQCGKLYWTREGLAKHYKARCSRASILPKIEGMTPVDVSKVPAEDVTMSLLPATPDDEEGEDPRPDEQPRPSEEVGPLTANLTRQEFYDTMGYALMEHRRFQTKQRQFQDQMMVALVWVVCWLLVVGCSTIKGKLASQGLFISGSWTLTTQRSCSRLLVLCTSNPGNGRRRTPGTVAVEYYVFKTTM